jgi:thiamine biosynthesis lipoprotein
MGNPDMARNCSLRLYSFLFHAMGTECHLHLYAADEAAATSTMQAAVAEVGRIEARYSRYLPGSFLLEINRVAESGGGLAVDPETAGLLDFAWACYANSGALFDITSGLLRRVWDFKSGLLPARESVEALLPKVGLDKVVWENPVLRFPTPGLELDFGGLGKEYAADSAAAVCSARGIRHGLVDLGGDIVVIGPHPDGAPWRVGIQLPGRPGALMAEIKLSAGALASSGDYERYILADGLRYGHILDPRTGWPARGLSSVSAVSAQCMVAGSVSTIAVLKGALGVPWLQSLDVSHCWMDEDGRQGGTLPLLGAAGPACPAPTARPTTPPRIRPATP